MNADRTVRQLIAHAQGIPAVDSHQHLRPEKIERTDLGRMMLDDNYLLTDLVAAGLTDDLIRRAGEMDKPVWERWQLLAPFWEKIRHGGYGQGFWITLRDLYGARSLSGKAGIERVSGRISHDYARPGIFRRVLYERCNIAAVLSQHGTIAYDRPKFHFVARPRDICDFAPGGLFEQAARKLGFRLKTADELAPAMDAILKNYHATGAIGFKIHALPWRLPGNAEVKQAFQLCRKLDKSASAAGADVPLVLLFWSRIAALAAELDIPVAVHTGAPWSNWLDFRGWEPTGMIPMFQQYRRTRFDLYHAGIPYVTPFGMLGKTFPNVWLNLCWAHIISAGLSMRAMNEWLDLVPVNKIIAFGGDFSNRTVSLTYGHLVLARQNVAEVLANRIDRKTMTLDQAENIIRAWFSDNPRALYRLA